MKHRWHNSADDIDEKATKLASVSHVIDSAELETGNICHCKG